MLLQQSVYPSDTVCLYILEEEGLEAIYHSQTDLIRNVSTSK